MIICKSCCMNNCANNATCPIPINPHAYIDTAMCNICGQSGFTVHCITYMPKQERSDCASTPPPAVARLLEVLIPVAETLAERGKKYEGVYETLRERYGPTAFALEIDKKLLRWIRCPDDEAVAQEAFLDIIGYVILEKEYLQKRKDGQPMRAKLRVEKAVPKIVEPEEFRKEGTD